MDLQKKKVVRMNQYRVKGSSFNRILKGNKKSLEQTPRFDLSINQSGINWTVTHLMQENEEECSSKVVFIAQEMTPIFF